MTLPMPTSDRIPAAPPADEQLLAALERGQRHTGKPDEPGIVLATLVDHLGFDHSPWTTRRVRPSLEALQGGGFVERYRRHGVNLWRLTPAGRKRLSTVRSAGQLDELPESPQHRRWREARAAADERIVELRRNLRKELAATQSLLAGTKTSSERWLTASDALTGACKLLASATYCLYEWSEPDDATADVDEHPHRSRRGDIA